MLLKLLKRFINFLENQNIYILYLVYINIILTNIGVIKIPKLLNKRVIKYGSSYCFIIPKSFVDNEILKIDERYDINIVKTKNE